MSVANTCKRCLFITLAFASTALILKFCSTPTDLQQQQISTFEEEVIHFKPDNVLYRKRNTAIGGELRGGPSSKRSKDDLPNDVIDKVEKFVFFIGYPRSGHSIVGSFLDAHPHMVIAHEFMLFRRLKKLNKDLEMDQIKLIQSKNHLFNSLYHSSAHAAMSGWRSESRDFKNYTLSVDSPWVGKYNGYMSVIGDKSGGMTANMYAESPEQFTAHYQQLKRTLGIPIMVIHCIRNPYDIASTNTLYAKSAKLHNPKFVSVFKSNMSKLHMRHDEFMAARFDNEKMLARGIEILKNQTKAVVNIMDLVGMQSVLDIHNSDLVNDPYSTLTKICGFLKVECSPEYLRSCSEKVFKSVSKSRDMVVWTQRLRNMMDSLIDTYSFYHRYYFSSE